MRFPSKLLFGTKARTKLLKGINIVADAVKVTLGPKSSNVGINNANGAPDIIHDGVGVARRIDLMDEFEDMGAQLLKEAAIKTNKISGDGTTTSTIIAQKLCNLGHELIVGGANPMTLKTEVEEASKFVVSELKKLSREVKGEKEIEKVATISSADPKIGKIVSEAITKTGEDGVIDIEIGKGVETEVEYKQGMEIDRGFKSQYFINKQDTLEAVIEDAYVLITDKKINHALELAPFMNNFLKHAKNLVIIGEVEEEALATLVVNRLKGVLNVLAIQPPAFGDRQIHELEDIASLVGGTVITVDSGRSLDTVTIEELGRADKISADVDRTIILGGKGNQKLRKQRIEDLKEQIKNAKNEYDKEIKKQRLSKLTGSAAIIKIGGVTEAELPDKKERVIDAVSAAKASIDEGIVAGGQISFLTISQLKSWPQTQGARLLREAIKEPFKILVENTGYDYAESFVKISPIKYPIAIDVTDGEVKDMIEAGVIDPTKVARSSVENAVSVASMAWTTKVLITEPYKGVETK